MYLLWPLTGNPIVTDAKCEGMSELHFYHNELCKLKFQCKISDIHGVLAK